MKKEVQNLNISKKIMHGEDLKEHTWQDEINSDLKVTSFLLEVRQA